MPSEMTPNVHAPWSDEQCFLLNAYQHSGVFHEYTCGNDSGHMPLIATRDGWKCFTCGYQQDWAMAIDETRLRNAIDAMNGWAR